jgi:hypothetical protein
LIPEAPENVEQARDEYIHILRNQMILEIFWKKGTELVPFA